MDRTLIRAWRRIQEKRLWRNRIKYYANNHYRVINSETGLRQETRDWKVLKKEHWMLKLKDTATICSCWMCRNYLYDRQEYKRTTARILREQTED